MREPSLPHLMQRNPDCSNCYEETEHDGDSFVCTRCRLAWHDIDDDAQFLDEDEEPCGAPDPTHVPKITTYGDDCEYPNLRGRTFRHVYHPCNLPASHTGDHHFALTSQDLTTVSTER